MDNTIPPQQTTRPAPNPEVAPKPKSSKYILLTVLLVLFIILLGVIYYFVEISNTSVVNTQIPPTPIPSPSISTPQTLNTSNWETYTDADVGFSFKYPKTVSLNGETKGATDLVLLVSAEKLSDIPQDLPMFMGRNDAIKEKEDLITGDGVGLVKIGSLNGQVATTHSRFEVCSVLFEKTVTFYPGEYRVILNLIAADDVVTKEMPEFFIVDEANCGTNLIWNQDKISQFDQALKDNKGKGIAQQWYDTFNGIVDTITLSTPVATTAVTVAPTTEISLPKYTNNVYGFEISYPQNYKALDSKDDLYGYPNGIVLLYGGGQAYDVVVEIWDTKAEYESEYSTRMSDLTVIPYGDKFITLLDNTGEPENKQVISSFKLL